MSLYFWHHLKITTRLLSLALSKRFITLFPWGSNWFKVRKKALVYNLCGFIFMNISEITLHINTVFLLLAFLWLPVGLKITGNSSLLKGAVKKAENTCVGLSFKFNLSWPYWKRDIYFSVNFAKLLIIPILLNGSKTVALEENCPLPNPKN